MIASMIVEDTFSLIFMPFEKRNTPISTIASIPQAKFGRPSTFVGSLYEIVLAKILVQLSYFLKSPERMSLSFWNTERSSLL